MARALRWINLTRYGERDREDHPAETLALYELEVAQLEKSVGPDHPFVAETLADMADLVLEAAFEAALDAMDEDGLDEFDEVGMNGDEERFRTQIMARTDLLRAAELLERALEIHRRANGPGSEEVAFTLEELSAVHRGLGDVDRADGMLAEARLIEASDQDVPDALDDEWALQEADCDRDEPPRPSLVDMSAEALPRASASWTGTARGRAMDSPNRRLVMGLLPFPLARLAGLSRKRRREDQESAVAHVDSYRRAADLPVDLGRYRMWRFRKWRARRRSTGGGWDAWESATVGSLIICAFLCLLTAGIALLPSEPEDTIGPVLPLCGWMTLVVFPVFWLIIYLDQPRGERHW